MKIVFKWIGIIVAVFFVLVLILAVINPKTKDNGRLESTTSANAVDNKNALPNPFEFMKKWNALNDKYSDLKQYPDNVDWLPTPSQANTISVQMEHFNIQHVLDAKNRELYILQKNDSKEVSDLSVISFLSGATKFIEVFWPNTSPEEKRSLFEELGVMSAPSKDIKIAIRGNISFGYSASNRAIMASLK
jgi:hypothetical protein